MSEKRQLASHIDAEVSPQLTVLIVLGEWLAAGRSSFWLRELLSVTDNLGAQSRSIRTVVQRLTQTGWFDTERTGRESHYRLTPLARRELQRGDARIFHHEQPKWDGRWHLIRVTADVASRDTIGRNLTWLGFGQFAPTIWICPWNRISAGRAVIADVAENATSVALSRIHIAANDVSEIVASCWNLDAIEAADRKFVTELKRILSRWRRQPPSAHHNARLLLSLDASFIAMLRRDPGLPTELLPDEWPGSAARKLFEEARSALVPRDRTGSHPFEPT